MGVLCWSLFWYASFLPFVTRDLIALLLLSFGCFATVNILWPFLTAPRVGLQCVIMVLPAHARLRFQ